MVGARVNGKLVPIEYQIKNGDRIEIITSQNSQGPSRDWLNLVKSTQAKNKINQWFKKELKEDNILKGKDMLTQYAKSKGYKLGIYTKPQFLESVMRKYGFRDWDSVLAAIGHGGLKEGQVFNKLMEAYDKENQKNLTDEQVLEATGEAQEKLHVTKNKGGIVVKGIHDVAVRFSKCCSPIPGDEIVGFVTRGRGITIHRTDCVNVLNMSEMDRSRLIEAEWQPTDNKGSEKYMAEIQVYANNRTGLLVDLSKIFTERKIDMRSINSRTSKQEKATISISFEIGSKEELSSPLPEGISALTIPNAEIREIFETTIIKWFEENAKTWNRLPLFQAVWDGNSDSLTQEMNRLLRKTISYHDYKEDFYHAFLAGIFTGAGYSVESNKEHGEGRSDIIVYDPVNGQAAVFEAKYSNALEYMESDCNRAIAQIDARMYAKELEDDYDHVFCYGIAFYKKRCLVKKKEG